MHDSLKDTISALKEKELTLEILIPLVEKLHPGRTEYTHSTMEAGRDIVSFGKDYLGRQHILCIQAKAIRISYGASSFQEVVNAAQFAKNEGVTSQDGNIILPDEVWIITSQVFPEPQRKLVANNLKELNNKGIKLIALDELCPLIIEHIPDIATKLSKYTDSSVTQLISAFSKHSDSRAFGFAIDRLLEDFYIPVTFAPHAKYANLLLEGSIVIDTELKKEYHLSLKTLMPNDEINGKTSSIYKKILEIINKKLCTFSVNKQTIEIKHTLFANDNYNKYEIIDYKNTFKKIQVLEQELKAKNKLTKKDKEEKELELKHLNYELNNYYFNITIDFDLVTQIALLKRQTKAAINTCPKVLGQHIDKFIETYGKITFSNSFVKYLLNEFDEIKVKERYYEEEIIRIRVPEPIRVLELSDFILIEGPPGSGKTTFLKVLAMNVLDNGGKILYVPCGSIPIAYAKKSLDFIIRKCEMGRIGDKWKNEDSILILDGLDEAPFDLADLILNNHHKYKKIFASARTAYSTKVRDEAFNIGLAMFKAKERDKYFERWFFDNEKALKDVKQLIKKYEDIDYHTRLPLIATLTASLIENGYEPTTRSEIYNYRLDLLLSKWDRSRGVERNRIDNPKAKRMFLMTLAFNVHNSINRRRYFTLDDVRIAYEQALGNWGYEHDYQLFLDDLIVGSGIIFEEQAKIYSFGHLSFQEHLAGEYLNFHKFNNSKIKDLLLLEWWREPLLFYASAIGDITKLVQYISQDENFFNFSEILNQMAVYAPYTNPGVIEIVKESIILVDEERIQEENSNSV